MTAQRRFPRGDSKFSIFVDWQHRYALAKVEDKLGRVTSGGISVHGFQPDSNFGVVSLAFDRLEPIYKSISDNGVRKLENIGTFRGENQPRSCRICEVNDYFVKTHLR